MINVENIYRKRYILCFDAVKSKYKNKNIIRIKIKLYNSKKKKKKGQDYECRNASVVKNTHEGN